MSIITSYQEERALEQPRAESARLATVHTVDSARGLALILDGEQESDGKYYQCNTGMSYHAGDRVLVQKVSGSYVVICRIGKPPAES